MRPIASLLRNPEETALTRGALAKMATTLLDHWKVSPEDQTTLLGINPGSKATLATYRSGEPLDLSPDQYERIHHLLGIHRTLRLLFPQNRDLAYRWMTSRNKEFNNSTPVAVVMAQGVKGLLSLRGYLDRTLY